jgi:hypothetical protein
VGRDVEAVSAATVQRIWSSRGLKPHQVKTFNLFNDPKFEEKLIDVVGLYLNPRDNAVCCAWTRSPRSGPGPDPTLAADGQGPSRDDDARLQAAPTTTLFAALNVLTGVVVGQCLPRHRHEEFLRFLKTIDKQTPQGWTST